MESQPVSLLAVSSLRNHNTIQIRNDYVCCIISIDKVSRSINKSIRARWHLNFSILGALLLYGNDDKSRILIFTPPGLTQIRKRDLSRVRFIVIDYFHVGWSVGEGFLLLSPPPGV